MACRKYREYDVNKYIKLLNYQKTLYKEGKVLMNEDGTKYLELLEYSVRICDHMHWSQKNEYLQLIEKFLNSKIDGEEFENKFLKIFTVIEDEHRRLERNYEELKLIEPNLMSLGFGEWISEIYLCCNEFYSDFNEEKDRIQIPFGKTEEQLREAVRSLLPEIQKYY